MPLAVFDSFITNDGGLLSLPDYSTSFNVLNISPSRKVRAAYSNRHIAYNDGNTIQLGGKLPPELTWSLYVPDESTVDDLLEAVSRQGILTCHKYPGGVQCALVEADDSD